MMPYLDGVLYGKETEFSNDRLIELMPEDIMRFFFILKHLEWRTERRGETKT